MEQETISMNTEQTITEAAEVAEVNATEEPEIAETAEVTEALAFVFSEVEHKKRNLSGKRCAAVLSILIIAAVAALGIADALGAPMLRYRCGLIKLERGEFAAAQTVFERLGDYADAEELAREAEKGLWYLDAGAMLETGDFSGALAIYETLGNFRDTADMIRETKYRYAKSLLAQGERKAAQALLEEIEGYRNSIALRQDIIDEDRYDRAIKAMARENYAFAAEEFRALGDYRDAAARAEECELEGAYREGSKLYANGNWIEACSALLPIRGKAYKDTDNILDEMRDRAQEYTLFYAEKGERVKALAFLSILKELDEETHDTVWQELVGEVSFTPDQSFYVFDTTHVNSFTANTPREEFASVVLYMLLHGKTKLPLMSNKPVDYDILYDKAFQGSSLAQEMLPGYGSVYNPSVEIGENYVVYSMVYEQEYSEHQRTMHLKDFKSFCEDSVRQLMEIGLLSNSMSRRQKAEVILNWVGYFLTYDDSLSIHDVGVAVEKKRGVCESFAALYNRMCNYAGIPTYGQVGDAWSGQDWGGHIWSFHVDEDGKVFYTDSTWADLWDIDFGAKTEEPTIESFAKEYLGLCMQIALAEQSGAGTAHLQRGDRMFYVWSDFLWSNHKAERTAEEIIAYHNKITGQSA